MPDCSDKKIMLIAAVNGDIGDSYAKSVFGEEFLLLGCDMNMPACDNPLLEDFFQVPPANQPEKYFEAILGICQRASVDLIVPISEPEIKTFHEHRDVWSSWKETVLINNEVILDHFLDKYETVQFLKSIGIETPKTFLLKDYQGQLSFPMIVKQRNGCGSKNIWKVESDLDLNYFKGKDDGSFLIQEYLEGDDQEYTTGIFSDGASVSSITFKRKLGLGGLSVEVDLIDSDEMDLMARKLARATSLIGSINIQTRLRGEKFIPFEINPRFSSTLSFRKQFGFEDCLWWPRISLGGEYVYQRKYKAGKGTRYLAESYTQMDRF